MQMNSQRFLFQVIKAEIPQVARIRNNPSFTSADIQKLIIKNQYNLDVKLDFKDMSSEELVHVTTPHPHSVGVQVHGHGVPPRHTRHHAPRQTRPQLPHLPRQPLLLHDQVTLRLIHFQLPKALSQNTRTLQLAHQTHSPTRNHEEVVASIPDKEALPEGTGINYQFDSCIGRTRLLGCTATKT